tara:strand:+ start:8801 stop:10417 length:1617 start_codon:yes stop_codon:yes gene_type:complete
MVEEIKVPKKEWLSMKATIKKLQSGAKKVQEATGSDTTSEFKLGGGFFDVFDEGAALYDLKKDSIKSTGLLLDELTGPAGFISKFAKMSEGGVSIFGSIKPTIEAFKDLSESSKSFAMNQTEVQSAMGKTLSVFKALGVAAEDFSAVLDSARLGFGMTGEAAESLARSVGGIGLATGVGMGAAMKNFRSAQSSMAYDSKKLMENFKQLQFTAGATGISFDKLTSAFGDSMDTFEGSAGKAGNLNAILGRSVFNSIDLLGKTEAERVSTIVKGIRESTNVQALSKNKFQLKAVAEGLGLTPDETRKLLTGQTSVDAVLAGKAPKDKREEVISKMADLIKEKANPAIEDFVKTLNRGRTEFEITGAKLNAKQRKFFQEEIQTISGKLFGRDNAVTANTTGELFTYAEGALVAAKNNLSTGDFGEFAKNMKQDMKDVVTAVTGNDKEKTKIALKKLMGRFAFDRKTGKVAKLTPSTAARTGRFTNQETNASMTESTDKIISSTVSTIADFFSKGIALMIDGEQIDARIVGKVKNLPVGTKP